MLSANEIEAIPEKLTKLFRGLQFDIFSDVVKRLTLYEDITRSTDWEIYRLYELGESKKVIRKKLKKALDLSDSEIDQIYSNILAEDYARYKPIYEELGAKFIPFSENEALQQMIEGLKDQTKEEFRNITQSLGFMVKNPDGTKSFTPIAKYYQNVLDRAEMGIVSGAFDYNTMIRQAIKELTNSGLRTVDYASGWSNRVDVAARRALLTGFNQVVAKITEDNAEKLGTDHFEVTYHIGARPTHQPWQGRVYSKEKLVTVCGYGEVDGLKGANCYHDFHPFFKGISKRIYSDEELDRMNAEENTPKEYNGKQYTTYEALQRQRHLETTLRAQRQEIKLLEQGHASEDDIIAAKSRYFKTSAEYAEFSRSMGLPQQRERVTVDGIGTIKKTPKTSESIQSSSGGRSSSVKSSTKVSDTPTVSKLSEENTSKTIEKTDENDIIKERISQIQKQEIPNLKTDTVVSRQEIHRKDTKFYQQRKDRIEKDGEYGPSYVTISDEEILELVNKYKGTGMIKINKKSLNWNHQEVIVDNDKVVGVVVNNLTGAEKETTVFKIHYSKDGVHIVPDYPSKKKG